MDPRQNLTDRSRWSFGSGTDHGGGEHVVPLDLLLLVEVGSYECSFIPESTVVVELVALESWIDWETGKGGSGKRVFQ